jgi:hypothetical protein
MSDSRFWFEERLGEQKEDVAPTEDVLHILKLFAKLSLEDKISAKKMINKERLI